MEELAKTLTTLGQASYVWDIGDGQIDWSDNFTTLMGFNDGIVVNDARKFEKLLVADSEDTRFSALQKMQTGTEPDERARTYQCIYAVHSDHLSGDEHIWIEDLGYWQTDDKGKPIRASGIIRVINNRRKREESLVRLSKYDDLTGLVNRNHFHLELERVIKSGFVEQNSSAFLIVALNDFDRINSVYGFTTGDEILEEVARILGTKLREGDILARFSGAKFALLLNRCKEDEFKIAARRIADAIGSDILETSAGPLSLKVAIGACLLPKHAQSAYDAISAATKALDDTRKMRFEKIKLHEPDPKRFEKREAVTQMLASFIDSLDNGAMHLVYQPVVDAHSHSIAYHESLLRMDRRDDGLIQDASFIALAEDLGLIKLVDLRAQKLVLDALEKYPDAKLALNITHESLENETWFQILETRLPKINSGGDRLIVEIIESQLPADVQSTRQSIERIQAMGCKVAIDDFGAGYTSFSHLKDLDVDIVKMDGLFCRGLKQDPRNGEFLKAMQKLASAFGVKTVVEWVEDIETAVLLKEWGFDCLQGSLFGMPLPILPWDETATSPQAIVKERRKS